MTTLSLREQRAAHDEIHGERLRLQAAHNDASDRCAAHLKALKSVRADDLSSPDEIEATRLAALTSKALVQKALDALHAHELAHPDLDVRHAELSLREEQAEQDAKREQYKNALARLLAAGFALEKAQTDVFGIYDEADLRWPERKPGLRRTAGLLVAGFLPPMFHVPAGGRSVWEAVRIAVGEQFPELLTADDPMRPLAARNRANAG